MRHRCFNKRNLIAIAAVSACALFNTYLSAATVPMQLPASPPIQLGTQHDQEKVKLLVKQLAADTFAERQLAIEQLWQMGPEIGAQLESAMQTSDAEVAKRLRGIIDAINLGIDSNTPRSTALMVIYFSDGERRTRGQILNALGREKQYQLALDLLQRLDDPVQVRGLFSDYLDLPSIISMLGREMKWEQIRAILEHPVVWQNDNLFSVYYAKLNGRMPELIANQNSIVDKLLTEQAQVVARVNAKKTIPEDEPPNEEGEDPSKVAKPKTDPELLAINKKTDVELIRLIQFLRVEDQKQQALAWVEKLSTKTAINTLRFNLKMEMGDWKTVSRSIRLPKEADDGTGKTKGNLRQQALAYHFANDVTSFDRIIQRLVKEASGEFKGSVNSHPVDHLVNVLLTCGQWELAAKYLDRSREGFMFDLYCYLQRFDLALESIGLSEDIEQRLLWFERLIRHLGTLDAQYKRTKNDKNNRKSVQVFSSGVSAASQLANLGFTDEAILHLHSLIESVTDKTYSFTTKRRQVLRAMVDIGRPDEVWKIVRRHFSVQTAQSISSDLHGKRSIHAEFWKRKLIKLYPDIFRRHEVIARLLNSSLQVADDPLNMDVVFSNLLEQPGNQQSYYQGELHFQIAMVMFFHGNFQRFRDHLNLASELGFAQAVLKHAQLVKNQGDMQTAADSFDDRWMQAEGVLSLMQAADIYERMGKNDEAMFRRILAFAQWRDTYRSEAILKEFEQEGKSEWLLDLLQVNLYGRMTSPYSMEHLRRSLVIAQATVDPDESANNQKIVLFNRFRSNNAKSSQLELATSTSTIGVADARGLIKRGETEAALEVLLACNRFRPGDPELAEKMVRQFDELGEHDKADRLFSAVTEYYMTTLEKYPDSPIHNNNYAWICAANGRRLEYAIKHSEIAVEQRPHTPSYLDTLAELSFLAGDQKRAIELSRRCLQIEPTKVHYLNQYLRFGGKL